MKLTQFDMSIEEFMLHLADWVSHLRTFRPEGSTRDIEYSERAVFNVYKRYPDRIEKKS